MTRLPTLALADMATALSPAVESLAVGCAAWTKGYVRAAAVQAQYRATLDLLVLEQSGTPLTAAAAGQITRDPVSGAAFVFDPATRTLAAPPSSVASDIKPLALPW